MKIGILKADDVRLALQSDHGDYPQMIRQLFSRVDASLSFVTYDVVRGEYPQHIDEVQAYLITGSKFSVYDDEPWIKKLGGFVQELHRHKKKLVGICFGHQLVAHYLGGISARSASGWGIGVHESTLSEEAEAFGAAGKPYRLISSHQDQVIVPAPGSRILAGSDFCPFGMLQLGSHIFTVQGHPEFTHDYSRALMNLRREVFGDKLYAQGMDSLSRKTDGEMLAHWILEFLAAEESPQRAEPEPPFDDSLLLDVSNRAPSKGGRRL